MATKKGNKNVLDLLEHDHEKLKHLLDRLEGTSTRGAKTRERVIEEIHRELEVHTAIEEELVYPAIREAASDTEGEELHFEMVEEHFLAGEVELPRMLDTSADSDEFTAKCVVLKELVTHHIEEEESRLFSRARELCDEETLVDLGRRVEARKKELLREIKKAA
jgi:hemerythrin superfamily protein